MSPVLQCCGGHRLAPRHVFRNRGANHVEANCNRQRCDDLISHPVALAFVSKLNSLCRMTLDREMAALRAIDLIAEGQTVEYEVIEL